MLEDGAVGCVDADGGEAFFGDNSDVGGDGGAGFAGEVGVVGGVGYGPLVCGRADGETGFFGEVGAWW